MTSQFLWKDSCIAIVEVVASNVLRAVQESFLLRQRLNGISDD